jgi:hypothetical protein
MCADANCASKNADSYAYEYTQCYTNGYRYSLSDSYAYGYCQRHC